jgi:hypothetical protein
MQPMGEYVDNQNPEEFKNCYSILLLVNHNLFAKLDSQIAKQQEDYQPLLFFIQLIYLFAEGNRILFNFLGVIDNCLNRFITLP